MPHLLSLGQLVRCVKAVVVFGGLFAAFASVAQRADLAEIAKSIEGKDCATAVTQLNTALAKPDTAVLLFAGVMFEDGLCLKPNVERAARMFVRALEAPGASARLAALYASRAAVGQHPLALWWAAQADLPMPQACALPPEARKDADTFSRHLGQWPSDLLMQCVHVAGVVGALDAELTRAIEAADRSNSLGITFDVARGQVAVGIEIAQGAGIEAGAGTGVNRSSAPGFQRHQEWSQPDRAQEQRNEVRRALAGYIEKLGQKALAKAVRPEGAMPAWKVEWSVAGQRP